MALKATADGPSGVELPDLMFLQTALCYLMTRHSVQPCSGVASLIAQRLQILLDHPDGTNALGSLAIYRQLLQQWQYIARQ